MVKKAGNIGASVTSTVTSPVLHPINTAKTVTSSVLHPIDTAINMTSYVNNTRSSVQNYVYETVQQNLMVRMAKRAGNIGATVTSTVTAPVLHPIDTAINVTSYVNPLAWIRSKPVKQDKNKSR